MSLSEDRGTTTGRPFVQQSFAAGHTLYAPTEAELAEWRASVTPLLLAWKLYDRFASALSSNEATYDLRLPVWLLIGLIWLGAVAAVITTTARLIALIRGSDLFRESDLT